MRKIEAFISYSHEDIPFLEASVLPAFRAAEVVPWINKAIVAGEIWYEVVSNKIQNGDWLVILLTEAYQAAIRRTNGPCYHEFAWIIDAMTTSRSPGRLIVVWRDGEELPHTLKAYQAIDVRTNTDQLVPMLKIASEKDRNVLMPPSPTGPRVHRPDQITPETLPDLARYNFESKAREYAKDIFAGRSMQGGNVQSLLSLVAELYRDVQKPKSWLDVGCGPGLVPFIAEKYDRKHQCGWLIRCDVRIGFDYAPTMLQMMPSFVREHYTDLFEGDLRMLSSDWLQRITNKTRLEKVDLILANNVVHWLFSDQNVDAAFRAFHEVLNEGGCIGLSVAADGTAGQFLCAYRTVLETNIRKRLSESDGAVWQGHLTNPIGL